MDKLFTSFQSLLNIAYLFYKRRNIFLKFVFWFYLFTQFGLSYIFAGIEKFYYRLPDENGFSLVGRKALIRNTDSLDLYEYVNRSKCNENDNDIKYLKVAKINCAKITKVTDLESKEQNTNQDPGIFPAVVMNDGTVVYLDYETNGLSYTDRKYIKWNIVSWKDGVTKIVKEYKVFDLGKFAEDYQQGKVKFDESIKEQTGVIWSENFKVIDQNTIGFLDLMIVTVDNEKPTEAIVRERQLNIFTGEETMRERERESLDVKEYKHNFTDNKGLYSVSNFFKWYIFRTNPENSLPGKSFIDYSGIERDYYDKIRKIYLSADNYIEYKKEYIYGTDETCGGSFMFRSFSCTKWYEQNINLVNNNIAENKFKMGYLLYNNKLDNIGDMKFVNISEKKDLLVANLSKVHGVPLGDYGITPIVDYMSNIGIDINTKKTSLLNYYGTLIYLK